jgi:hypothetical protein
MNMVPGIGNGHVRVGGDLIEDGRHEQKLKFEFVTDQTCLRPLINALQKLAQSPATLPIGE